MVGPGAVAAAQEAASQAARQRDQVRDALGRDLEAARYAVDRAFRQYDAEDPANRLVAGELEARLNRAHAKVEEIESNVIEVHIHNLRQKLGRDLIETVRGLGYRLKVAP